MRDFRFRRERVTVSLAPADVRKIGAAFDLPIALGILAASGALPHREESRFTIVGGVSLDGTVPPMRGLLPIAVAARDTTGALVFPRANVHEASVVRALKLFPVGSLMDAARVLVSPAPTPSLPPPAPESRDRPQAEDLSEVRGQLSDAARSKSPPPARIICCLRVRPGAGKTMLARRLPGILPPLEPDEALTVTTIHSVAGQLPADGGLLRARPFRSPHHTCSDVALVGGGSTPRPGELSLAHGGVLFLDELPEFSRRVLETLRQPLEHGLVHIARANHSVTFPASVMLVGAMNPCPCGFLGSPHRACTCPPLAVERYQRRLSGPLRDRFDLWLDIPALPWADMQGPCSAESSAAVRERVVAARARQLARQGCTNARLEGTKLQRVCQLEGPEADRLLGRGVERFGLSARAVSRVLRVARTLADLEHDPIIRKGHIAEALQLRGPDSGSLNETIVVVPAPNPVVGF